MGKYVLPQGAVIHIDGFPAQVLHEVLIESGTELPLERSNDSVEAMLARVVATSEAGDALPGNHSHA